MPGNTTRAHRWAAALAACLVLAGCGQASPSQGSPGGAAPPASGSTDWNTVLAAAKREGRVSVILPQGDTVNTVLVEPFQKQYGIQVDSSALSGNASTSRINLERGGGQYNVDVLISGSAGILDSLVPNKALDPIEPALILPEVKDRKNWRGGALPVIGANHEVLVMTPYQRGTVFYNKNMVKDDEI
ncbi:MAG TPA: hypothetical protein VF157_04735, partial [Chloroflexota bacterium]